MHQASSSAPHMDRVGGKSVVVSFVLVCAVEARSTSREKLLQLSTTVHEQEKEVKKEMHLGWNSMICIR